MVLGIPSVAMEVGQVDATDERDAIIDHDRLLVVAVHRPLPGVERALDAAARHQLIANLSSIATPGPQHGQRRTGPDQDPNGKAGGDVGEQLPQDRRRLVSREGKVWREVPPRDMDVRPGCRDGHGDRLECVGPIDQHLEGVSPPCWRSGLGPAPFRRIQLR